MTYKLFFVMLCVIGISFLLYWYKNRTKTSIKHNETYNEDQLLFMNNVGEHKATQAPVQYKPEPIQDNRLNDFIKRISNIIIGKYNLSDTDSIYFIKNNIIRYIDHLNMSTEEIINRYNPKRNKDLIYECSKDLFLSRRINILTKLLIGQEIIKNSQDNEEIMNIYSWISSVAINRIYPSQIRMNAMDILINSNNNSFKQTIDQALEILRSEDDKILPNIQKPKIRHNPSDLIVLPPKNNIIDLSTMAPTRVGFMYDRTADPEIQQRIMDDIVRRNREKLPKGVPVTERTVFSDGQNVHNTEINESVLKSAQQLIKDFKPTSRISFDYSLLQGMKPEKSVKIEGAIHRLMTDPTVFKYNITPYDTLQSLLSFIAQHKDKNELNKRLIEELGEMYSLCISGHISRLINVIQGFTDTMKINISINDEIYAKINHIMQQEIMATENNDDILEAFDSDDKTPLIVFCTLVMKKKMNDIYFEYKDSHEKQDIINGIIKGLDKYTKTTGQFKTLI